MSRRAAGAILLVLGIADRRGAGADVRGRAGHEAVAGRRTRSAPTSTMPVLLNAENFEFMRDLTTIRRHVAPGDRRRRGAGQEEQQLSQAIRRCRRSSSVTRSTSMEYAADHPAAWDSEPGFRPRGSWSSAGRSTGAADYAGWSDDYNSTVTLTYSSEVTHERSGLNAYLYEASSSPQRSIGCCGGDGPADRTPRDQLLALIGTMI